MVKTILHGIDIEIDMDKIEQPLNPIRSSKNFAKVKERDFHVCQKCGVEYSLEVHHIIPVYLGGNNDMKNLITLCNHCHSLAPDNPNEFKDYMTIPVKNGKLMIGILQAYHGLMLENIMKIFKLELEMETDDKHILFGYSFKNKSPLDKDFQKIIDIQGNVYDFMTKKVISVVNFNLDKCKSKELWEKSKP